MPESTAVTGPASEWLSSRREDLNARFRAAKRRFAKLDPQSVLALTGEVLAWRLGEARLREQALKAATQIPNSAALIALGLDGWPPNTAPLAVAALIGDAWTHPRERIRPQTLLGLTHAPRERIFEMLDKLAAPVAMPMTSASTLDMRLSGTCGEFAGVGGYFL